MIGVVDVGGGLRAAFGAGVLDGCLDKGISFDYGVGVSAGAANLCSYMAGQRGRNLPFFRDYSSRSEYLGLAALRSSHSLLSLDYIYGTLSNTGGENPLDYDAMAANPATLKIVATDAETGRPHYFDKSDLRQNDYTVLKASSCLPIVCRPVSCQLHTYFDGGLSDPIPFGRAFADGCTKVVVILTRPESWEMAPGNREERMSFALGLKYPAPGVLLRHRSELYNKARAQAEEMAAKGRLLLVAPDDCCGVDTLTKNPARIQKLYEKGLKASETILPFIGSEVKA